jgi:hypothetical protein
VRKKRKKMWKKKEEMKKEKVSKEEWKERSGENENNERNKGTITERDEEARMKIKENKTIYKWNKVSKRTKCKK